VSASGASGSSISKGVPTAGRIASGAIVEREVAFQLASMSSMRLTLRNPDFTTAQRIAEVVNDRFPGAPRPTIHNRYAPSGGWYEHAASSARWRTSRRAGRPAKVVIDEVAGVIVMGENVRLSTVAIQQGNLTSRCARRRGQPAAAFSKGGTTTVVPQSDVSVDEEKGKQFVTLKNGASLAS